MRSRFRVVHRGSSQYRVGKYWPKTERTAQLGSCSASSFAVNSSRSWSSSREAVDSSAILEEVLCSRSSCASCTAYRINRAMARGRTWFSDNVNGSLWAKVPLSGSSSVGLGSGSPAKASKIDRTLVLSCGGSSLSCSSPRSNNRSASIHVSVCCGSRSVSWTVAWTRHDATCSQSAKLNSHGTAG